ncbi:Cu(I)/Ag(I) efflux system membrane protein CusA/SilA [Cupriavidus sp. YR651]|uniref:efflux RND transporter permease subunit n=1 Tax=Cupriavidus sp. YR651 TaxID=1855315 RepID=UPI000883BC65|nr:CusA/CzcA family heavy metal efflux RND transporter [Cupriavidus sp. YR651]SDC54576.1 Cu(I)/Ag(I) efflux system membrane protein CusA/SilA [Cupriavidus sp. YR651]
MIARIIDWSIRHRMLVLLAAAMLCAAAVVSLRSLPLDALPDLSDTQVVVKTDYPGQPPQLVEDQVTYPLASALLSIPDASAVRGFSMYGQSYVYIVFRDGVAPTVARARVTEQLNQVRDRMPAGVTPSLGPDASGVGWILVYSVEDPTGKVPLDRLKALQDYYIAPELRALPGVAEIAGVGGKSRQYEIQVDPQKLAALDLSVADVAAAVRESNQAIEGGSFELARSRLVVRANGLLRSPNDLLDVPLAVGPDGGSVRLRDVARIVMVPRPAEGSVDIDGHGDAASAIVVMRQGQNTLDTIERVKARLGELQSGLPPGVRVALEYDRSSLILRAIDTLRGKLMEESLAVALVCLVFLLHLRSSLTAIVTLPVGILGALLVLRLQGSTANIMSLGGIAIAVGAMVDAAIVMVESMHRRLEKEPNLTNERRWELVRASAVEVGPSLFFSLVIVAVSFLPIFALQGQEAKLFFPLAFTKTYAMAFAAALAITLTPVLMGYAVRGKIRGESHNPLSRVLRALYAPLLFGTLRRTRLALAGGLLFVLSAAWPLTQMGSEFMPPLDEGDLLYMPTTLSSVSAAEAQHILQLTNRMILQVPEVEHVFGKVGRSDSATDPAPLAMIETTIRLKPRRQWAKGETIQDIIAKLDAAVRVPGLTNSWGYPIRTRIDMVSTGIRSQLALKVSGPTLAGIDAMAGEIQAVLHNVEGTRSVFAERAGSGRYLDIDIDRAALGRLGLRMGDVQAVIEGAVGGQQLTSLLDGRERVPVTLRLPSWLRDTTDAIGNLQIKAPSGARVLLRDIARIEIADGPNEVKSENAKLIGYVFVDVAGADIGGYYKRASAALAAANLQHEGYTATWTGQYLQFEHASANLTAIGIGTAALVLALLYLHFHSLRRVLLVLLCLPAAVAGGLWLIWALDYQMSVAVIIGFIALAGVATEFGVVMVLYLDQAVERWETHGRPLGGTGFYRAIVGGALLRLRPKAMTVSVILAGLLPVMLSHATGTDVMQRIAAPMIGGMLSAPLFSLLLMPALYVWMFGERATRAQPALAGTAIPTDHKAIV